MGEDLRVGIVHPAPYFDSVPSLVNAAALLARAGATVDVFSDHDPRYVPPALLDPRVTFHRLRSPDRVAGWQARLSRGAPAALRPVVAGLAHALPPAGAAVDLLAAAARARRLDAARPFSAFIAVDPAGLKATWALTWGMDAPVVYYSLELYPSWEVADLRARVKRAAEGVLARRAALVVVQDEGRGAILARDDGLDPRRLVYVPNGPLGPPRRRPSRLWHEKLALPARTRVLLHAGSVGPFTGIMDIVASTSGWPSDWCLVVHCRADGAAALVAIQARAGTGRVHVSTTPVPSGAFEELVDAADAVIAFYVEDRSNGVGQANLRTIGLSSGKIAYALRAGLPVIVNRAPDIAALLEREGCAAVVDDAAGIAGALAHVDATAAAMSARAMACFSRHFDVEPAFAQVVARLRTLRRPMG